MKKILIKQLIKLKKIQRELKKFEEEKILQEKKTNSLKQDYEILQRQFNQSGDQG